MICSKNPSHATVPLKRVRLTCAEGSSYMTNRPSSIKCGNYTVCTFFVEINCVGSANRFRLRLGVPLANFFSFSKSSSVNRHKGFYTNHPP